GSEVETVEKYGCQDVVRDVVAGVEKFERGVGIDGENEQGKSLLEGMEMVYGQLVEGLKNEGVEAIEAVGKEFG
uniref:nucleotide exchange factor GrpE n=1 Tax=Bacillus pumilus TaxID=1408 RepID=UPI0011AB0620